MSALDVIREINSLGLRVRLTKNGMIGVVPSELAASYSEDIKAILDPIRDEVIAYLQDSDQEFMKFVVDQAESRGYRAIQHRNGERPRRLA